MIIKLLKEDIRDHCKRLLSFFIIVFSKPLRDNYE